MNSKTTTYRITAKLFGGEERSWLCSNGSPAEYHNIASARKALAAFERLLGSYATDFLIESC